MKLEWNQNKNLANFEKHGIDFDDAKLVFSGKTVTFLDQRFDYGEERFITLGKLVGHVIVIVHTQRGYATKIISMRKANEREKKIYYARSKEIEKNEEDCKK